jgi:hypothetical protein
MEWTDERYFARILNIVGGTIAHIGIRLHVHTRIAYLEEPGFVQASVQ